MMRWSDCVDLFVQRKRCRTNMSSSANSGYWASGAGGYADYRVVSDGVTLYSYDQPIARWAGRLIEVDCRRYSQSTNGHQEAVVRAAWGHGVPTVCKPFPERRTTGVISSRQQYDYDQAPEELRRRGAWTRRRVPSQKAQERAKKALHRCYDRQTDVSDKLVAAGIATEQLWNHPDHLAVVAECAQLYEKAYQFRRKPTKEREHWYKLAAEAATKRAAAIRAQRRAYREEERARIRQKGQQRGRFAGLGSYTDGKVDG